SQLGEVDKLIRGMNDGDMSTEERLSAEGRLIELILPELRRIANSKVWRVPPSAISFFDEDDLVTEAIIILLYRRIQFAFQNKDHLLALFSRTMSSVLIDLIRKSTSVKRGGDQQHVSLGDAEYVRIEDSTDLIALNEALEDLAQSDKESARVVELLHFAGCTI